MGPWDPAVIGPIAGAVMVVAISLSVGSVLIFRPLTQRLGELLDQMRSERKHRPSLAESERLRELMERLLDRIETLEARQDFAERVIESAGWRSESGSALGDPLDPQRRGRTGGP